MAELTMEGTRRSESVPLGTESVGAESVPPGTEGVTSAGPSHETYLQTRTFGSLDGLRFASICAVVWHHYPLRDVQEVLPGAYQGFLGVDLFFVISGFLIVSLILRERSRTGTLKLGQFYLRRAFRIFPLYYGVLALLALKAVAKGVDTPSSQAYFEDLPILALYLANWIHGNGTYALAWSLAAEEQFYLIWPPIEKYYRRFVVPTLIVLIAISIAISLGWIDPLLSSWFGWTSSEPTMLRETTFVPILLGVGLAHALHWKASYEIILSVFGRRWSAPACGLALFVSANLLSGDVSGAPRLGIHCLMLALVASCVVREENGLAPLLKLPFVVRIGQLCYGIYLLHHIGMDLGFKLAGLIGVEAPVLRLLFGFAAVYGIAELSFRFYEARFVRLRAKYRP